jgi:hypothetical protein
MKRSNEMPAEFTLLGIGTLTLGVTPTDFSGEVLGAKITHEYEDIGEERTMLDGTVRPASQRRTDGFSASVENDLTALGLYSFLEGNDLVQVPFVFTPNTAGGAKWEGTVVAALPGEIGADEFGSPIVSDIEVKAVGKFVFTEETAV